MLEINANVSIDKSPKIPDRVNEMIRTSRHIQTHTHTHTHTHTQTHTQAHKLFPEENKHTDI